MQENLNVKTKNPNRRRTIGGITSALLIIALLLTGVFAFELPFQHRSNEFQGGGIRYDATLNERFYPVENWSASDPAVTKQINVTNTGANTRDFGSVFVRINLREFMEIFETTYFYWAPDGTTMVPRANMEGQAGLFMTDSNRLAGNPSRVFVVAPDTGGVALTEAAARTQIMANYAHLFPNGVAGHTLVHTTDFVSGVTGWFVISQAGDLHGQYGRYMVADVVTNTADSTLIGSSTPRATDVNHGLHEHNGECNYDIHLWNSAIANFANTTAAYREWVQWNLGADVILMSQWDGNPVAAWIIDDSATNTRGWIYWGQMLFVGDSTSNFLESVQLIQQPTGDFYYTIHTHMYAVSRDSLDTWTDMPSGIRDAFDRDLDRDDLYRALRRRIARVYGDPYGLPAPWIVDRDFLDTGFPAVTDGDGNLRLDYLNFPCPVLLDMLVSDFDTVIWNPRGDNVSTPDSTTYSTNFTQPAIGGYGGVITPAQVKAITHLYLNNARVIDGVGTIGTLYITSLDGTHLFPNLLDLQALGSNVTQVVMSRYPALTSLVLEHGNISHIDVSNHPDLRVLNVNSTNLSTLDLSNNNNLEVLLSSNDGLVVNLPADLSNMVNFRVSGNILPNDVLDLRGATNLFQMSVSETNITSLDVSGLTNLASVMANDAPNLTSINASGATSLHNLQANWTLGGNGPLTTVDLTGCVAFGRTAQIGGGGFWLRFENQSIQHLDVRDTGYELWTSTGFRINGNNMQTLVVPATGSTLAEWNTQTGANLIHRWTGNPDMVISKP